MLAMTISLLFAVAAVAALAVIYRSLAAGISRGRLILADLAEIESCAPVTRSRAQFRSLPALRPALAAV